MIKILEVTQIDLIGKRFNGYDMIHQLDNKKFDIKQAVLVKQSDDERVIKLVITNGEYEIMNNYLNLERELSIKNVLSITAPSLVNLTEYKEADIVHFHQFHNANLSLPYLRKIASEKKVIVSLHDPWMFTGHCVYPLECEKWKNGCVNCPNLENVFPINEDHCHDMWNLRKSVFEDIDVDILVYSDWMLKLVKQSLVFKNQKRIHKISFGIDDKKFNNVPRKEARKHYDISEDSFVFFTRTQAGFKGTSYVLEALKKLKLKNKKIVILTCDVPNLLDEVKDKYIIKDLGLIDDKEMSYALNACDVFLMPSIAESFGLMAIEAMSCSKPVIVFNNSALPSVTHAPECGYLVKNCDSSDLAKKMKFVIDNPKDVEKRGEMARLIVEKEYKLSDYNKKITDLYLEVSKKKKINKEYKISYEKDENTDQFKLLLNDLTVKAFGLSHPVAKELLYPTKGIRKIENYEFCFASKNMQNLIIDYTLKVYNLFTKNNFCNLNTRKKEIIEKFLYFLKHNPKEIKNIMKKG